VSSRVPRGQAAAISAHRGGGEDAPRGTYEAYQAAVRTGAEYVEFDIRRTADARLVVFHDPAVGPGQPVAGLSYAGLCRAAGYEVPRVDDVMRIIAGKADLPAHAASSLTPCIRAAHPIPARLAESVGTLP
jgi:glycerophosphoryl diester phosphodiesterase